MALPNVPAPPQYVKSKTVVWWDIDTCTIPDGYDARRVRPCIESALKSLGYTGPLTITAVGNLEKTPDVLRELSSTGINVKHSIPDRTDIEIYNDLMKWRRLNPPPATIMLISDRVEGGMSLPLCWSQQRLDGYNLLLAYSCATENVSILFTRAEWVWKSLLAADSGSATNKRDTRTHVLRKCSELSESASFFCTSCDFTGQSVENFTTHLSSEEHALLEAVIIKSRMPESESEEEESESESEEESKAKVEPPPKSKRLRKSFRTDCRLLHNHLGLLHNHLGRLHNHLGRLHNHLRLPKRRTRRVARRENLKPSRKRFSSSD